MSKTILSVQGLTKRYPGVTALDNVSIDFREGEVHALVGENGAGKSTLIKIIAGAVLPDQGMIEIDGEKFSELTPHKAKEKQIEVIYQEFNLVGSLSVSENISFGEKQGFFVNYRDLEKKALDILSTMGVSNISPKDIVQNLPSSLKQLVEIAKSISRNVKILIMDEPSAPLSVAEVDKLFEIIQLLKARGVTILYISHRMEEIFAIADRVTILRDGKYVATKNIGETNEKDLISLMVGRELSETYPIKTCEPGEEILSVENLRGNGVREISFSLRKGEILGISGLVGAGRTELVRMIFGADKIESGKIRINGQEVRINLPSDAISGGIGLIPEDRKLQGIFLEKSIEWNCSIASVAKLSNWVFVDRKKEKSVAENYQKRLGIKTPTITQIVKNLSGGNQQKVVLAKTLATESEILIFDEPTRGIDVGAKQEIYKLMRDLAESGKAILMITSDMQELLGMADRVIVLYKGTISGELTRNEFSQDRVLELASGLN